jgi:hypothetical protein
MIRTSVTAEWAKAVVATALGAVSSFTLPFTSYGPLVEPRKLLSWPYFLLGLLAGAAALALSPSRGKDRPTEAEVADQGLAARVFHRPIFRDESRAGIALRTLATFAVVFCLLEALTILFMTVAYWDLLIFLFWAAIFGTYAATGWNPFKRARHSP